MWLSHFLVSHILAQHNLYQHHIESSKEIQFIQSWFSTLKSILIGINLSVVERDLLYNFIRSDAEEVSATLDRVERRP